MLSTRARQAAYHEARRGEMRPRPYKAPPTIGCTHRGVHATTPAAARNTSPQPSVMMTFVSRNRGVDHTARGVCRRAMRVVHGAPTTTVTIEPTARPIKLHAPMFTFVPLARTV